MGERTRKRKRKFEDVAGIMEPGGEGFIYDPIFRIKLGTTPILKNFKVRSYLNFMASLPMKRNPATGYFEFAETPEEITALCKAYFFAAEPGALADSGYDQFRINKARHLLVQPVRNTVPDGSGGNFYPIVSGLGDTPIWKNRTIAGGYGFWTAAAVGAGGESPSVACDAFEYLGVVINVSAPTTITVLVAAIPGIWYEHTDIVFTAAGTKAQAIMNSPIAVKLRSSAAATITADLSVKT